MARLTESEFNQLLRKDQTFHGKVRELMEGGEFINTITYSTQKKDHVEIRYNKVKSLITEVQND